MIAVDTSAIMAIALAEGEMEAFDRLLEAQTALVGAPTMVEAGLVLASRIPGQHRHFLDRLRARRSVTVLAFEDRHMQAALDAHDRFGKGRGHPAQLNFGDCLSYAVAKVHDLPLLFKGDDFARTDIRPAFRS